MFGKAGDASRDVASNATASVLVATVLLLSASAAGVWWLSRHRSARRPFAWFAALGSIAGCVSFTLARDGAPGDFRPGNVFAWAGSGWDRLGHGDLLGSSQFLLNAALFAPAGLAWVWLTRRAARTLLGLAGLSMLIESLQAVLGLGAADITDVVANVIGAAAGVAAGVAVSRWIERSGEPIPSRRVGRKRKVVVAGTVVAVLAAVVVWLGGAERHQATIRHELEEVLSDTSYDELAFVLQGDPDDPDRLGPDARFSDGEQIFSAISVRADGFRYTDGQIELRWPALWFGLRRCVYVIWTPTAVQFRDHSGSACTDFIG